jgi:hypothetical protein
MTTKAQHKGQGHGPSGRVLAYHAPGSDLVLLAPLIAQVTLGQHLMKA